MTKTRFALPIYVLDLGPGAGKNGGLLIADGTPQQVMDNPASLTGQYLSGKIEIVARATAAAADRQVDHG